MYLILGKNGQLGQSFQQALGAANMPYYAPEESQADILSKDSLKELVEKVSPTFIINCAAYTDVEKSEDDRENAYLVNEKGPRIIAEICKEYHIRYVHFSTDYVFSGSLSRPYHEKDEAGALCVYGASKYAGERAFLESGAQGLVLRVSWLYSPYGRNFYGTMVRLAKERATLSIVMDQVGTPTYAPFLVQYVLQILPQFQNEHTGLYHLGDEGIGSWYDFAYEIIKEEQLECAVLPILSSEYPTKAQRPSWSVLCKEKVKKTFGVRLFHWREGVSLCHQNSPKIS